MIRKGVILAAGKGSRIRADGTTTPKPLRVVGGITLIRRTVLTMAAGGVKEVAVVVGHEAEMIREAVWRDARVFKQAGVVVDFVQNDEYELSNGVSVACAREFADGEPFVLSMSDHVYDVHLPAISVRAPMDDADLFLCVDRRIHDVYDPDDATKVVTRNDHIVDIGKQLTSYDCIDCGVFAVSERLLDCLDLVRSERGDCSLSDGVRRLAAAGRARVLDIGNAFWQDVDTPEAQVRAEAQLAARVRVGSLVRSSSLHA
jgi:choline kinase